MTLNTENAVPVSHYSELCGLDESALIRDLRRLADLDNMAEEMTVSVKRKQATLGKMKDEIREIEARITATAEASGDEISFNTPSGGTILARYTPGRASVSWDASRLDALLPPELRAVCLTYIPQADRAILGALELSGKLSADVIEAAKINTPARPRYVITRTPGQ